MTLECWLILITSWGSAQKSHISLPPHSLAQSKSQRVEMGEGADTEMGGIGEFGAFFSPNLPHLGSLVT